MSNEALKRLRDAVVRRDREVEVDPNGQVREIHPPDQTSADAKPQTRPKPTKLSARTFGAGAPPTVIIPRAAKPVQILGHQEARAVVVGGPLMLLRSREHESS